ncbi:hypothetical protein Tco_0378027 [Tanacetum coccineum]
MTKIIKEEFEKLGLLKIDEDLFTYDTQLGMIFNEFNKLSGINDDLFTCEIKVPKPTPCVEQTTNLTHNDLGEYEWKMSYEECEKIYAEAVILINKRLVRLIDVTMEQWLDLKYGNHKTMDINIKFLIKKGVYWMRGDDEVVLSNEEVSDLNDENNDDEQEIGEIFRIETNLFDYETPLYTEFNYLLKVDTELFTHDIQRTETYEDYENKSNNKVDEPWSEDGVPYEMCDHSYEPFRFKNMKAKWPTCSSNDNGFYNEGELPRMVRRAFRNFHELDYELLVKLQDYWWKVNDQECSPFASWRDHIRGPYANFITTCDPYLGVNRIFGRNSKASNNSNVQEKEEQHNERRCDTAHNTLVCKIRRFEMIKYSFGQDEEYVAIKEYEYDDLTKTNKDACRAYQEIFHIIDEGWVVTRAE